MSRERAEEFIPPANSSILSIYTPGCKPAKLHGSWETVQSWAREDNDVPMTPEDIALVWAWVEANKNRNLYVHCDAGISRSGGVAHAVGLYLAATPTPLEQSGIIDILAEVGEHVGMADLINTRIKADLVRHLWEKRLMGD
jgi:hypothetical protein